jgi:L-malate glycosyltransferase
MHVILTNDMRTIAGGENFVLYLASGLRDRGHTISIAPLQDSALEARSRELGFPTFPVAYGTGGKEFGAYASLVRTFRGQRVDVMHSNSYTDRTIAAFAGKRLGCANVASVHSCLSVRRNALHWFRNSFLVDRFVPDGHSTKDILVGRDRIPPDRVTVIHNGIPDDVISADKDAGERLRAEFSIPAEVPVFGAIGQMITFKGHRYLLDAVAALRTRRSDFRCVIVGSGELEAPLRSQASALGIESLVVFAGHRTDLAALYSLFDAFVMPSIDNGGETFPLVMVYALAAGLPVIGSKVGDIAYMVTDKNGFLLPPGEADLIANAMDRLLSEPGFRTGMGAHSRALYEDRFTLEKMSEKFELLYADILSRAH